MKQMLLEAFLPVLATLATALIPVMVGYIADRVRRWTSIEIEARHREALQSALANAARIILAGGTMVEGIAYVEKSVPDALKALKAESRVGELLKPHVTGGAAK
jgi:type II secretory pathway pseudopilin PulG